MIAGQTGVSAHIPGDGFQNPLFWADVPDPDVIRTGNDFWLVSTTMHLMPGAPVMHSTDLVNWETVSYLFDTLDDSPKYNMVGGTVYGKGQWATSLRHHDGTFYALFAPNDDQGGDSYIYKTTDPRKGWTLHSRLPHFHDSSFLFDDDGRVYVFHGTGSLTELSPDLKSVKAGGVDTVLQVRDAEETGLLEGSRVIKKDGKYYLLMISWPQDKPRRQLCYRADKVTGPYEKRVILEDNFAGFPYAGQGTIVDTPDGQWYGVIFQDRGGVGRVLTLEPCRWVDGWPMLGDADGKIPQTLPLPPNKSIVRSDEFEADTLMKEWQWNHNPVDSAWSLGQRPGWLRLHALPAENLFLARNTLSQRMEGPQCSAAVRLDLSQMRDGDCAGFSAFNGDAGTLTVSKSASGYTLAMTEDSVAIGDPGHRVSGVHSTPRSVVQCPLPVVFLRIDADFRLGRDVATFHYSADGDHWAQIGPDFQMRYDYRRLFMGTRYALFCYHKGEGSGGHVDADWFRYHLIP